MDHAKAARGYLVTQASYSIKSSRPKFAAYLRGEGVERCGVCVCACVPGRCATVCACSLQTCTLLCWRWGLAVCRLPPCAWAQPQCLISKIWSPRTQWRGEQTCAHTDTHMQGWHLLLCSEYPVVDRDGVVLARLQVHFHLEMDHSPVRSASPPPKAYPPSPPQGRTVRFDIPGEVCSGAGIS